MLLSQVTEIPVRHKDLEPCPLTRSAGLRNGYPGNGQDLPSEEKAKTGTLSKPAGQQTDFVIRRNSNPIVFKNDTRPFFAFAGGYILSPPNRIALPNRLPNTFQQGIRTSGRSGSILPF